MFVEYIMSFSTVRLICVLTFVSVCVHNISGDKISRLQKQWFNDVDGLIDVFVGICTENDNEPEAKAGIGVWFNSFHRSNKAEAYEGLRPTHLKAAMQGIITTCKQAMEAGVYNLRIHINNKQVIDICQNYLADWKANNWFKSNGRVMRYKEHLEKLYDTLKQMDNVEYIYVKRVGLYDESTLAYTLAKYGMSQYLRKVLKPLWRATRSTTEQITTTIKEPFREVKKIIRKTPKNATKTEDQ
uniref:RNase H type-1 domain-containing protein n=1 Tax=Cacopsylla melanoneura TaxID=428564 RepID=A0A8D8WWC7_9HEMI